MKKYSYGKQNINLADCIAVLKTLLSPFLTCGPKVKEFEQAICEYTGAKYCVVANSGTSALHLAMLAAGVCCDDEVITSPITFLASPNSARYVGAKVKFADIDPDTANIDPNEIKKALTSSTKVILPVHFAGQSCDMEKIYNIVKEHEEEYDKHQKKVYIIEDSAHAIGSSYKGHKVGSCKFSDMAVFSFHPVKNITTGEGGAITTNDEELYNKLLAYRSHGMHHTQNWEYEMRELGYNYRMTDLQASLGISQLKRLESFKKRRKEIVEFYNKNLGLPHLIEQPDSDTCFHLYPVFVRNRENFYLRAKEFGLNLQIHYIPVHFQPYYKELGFNKGDYPNAEIYYQRCISLPLHPGLSNSDLKTIVKRIKGLL